jgi:hypothetical protein
MKKYPFLGIFFAPIPVYLARGIQIGIRFATVNIHL